MKQNPIYRRETMVRARSFRLALVPLMFNGILALVALLNLYSTLGQVKLTAEIQYSSFLNLYMFVAVLEFVMVVFLMPAMTAGSISGERERRTLELMLTTKMTPADIIIGKLAASLSMVAFLVVSSFPVMAMMFIYGGVTLWDMGLLFLCYMTAALLAGSIGICCSAVFKKTTAATVASYIVLGILVAGTWVANQAVLYLHQWGGEAWLVSAGQGQAAEHSGRFLYLLLVNPAATFFLTMLRMAGQEQGSGLVLRIFGNHSMEGIRSGWVAGSIVIQVVMTGVFLWWAVKALEKGRR